MDRFLCAFSVRQTGTWHMFGNYNEIKYCLFPSINLLKRMSWIQFSHSVVSNSLRPMDYSMPDLPVHHQFPEFTETHIHRVSDAIQPPHPLSSSFPPAFNRSQYQGLYNESALSIRWPKYWSFSFNISPFNEYSGLISFRMDLLDLLAVQGTLFQESSPTPQFKSINSFGTQLSL